MNPIYKFELSAGGTTRTARPVYKDDLALDYALETNQQFYRAKLSGKLTFQLDDYTFINTAAFDTQFDLVIYVSYNGGQTWTLYWSGQFWKTDCEINDDDKTVIVTLNVNDVYVNVLAGLEKEFNLIDLAPENQIIKIDKRPLIQVYVAGANKIGCFLSNMWWEQDCNVVSDDSQLVNTYKFQHTNDFRIVDVEPVLGYLFPKLPFVFGGRLPQLAPSYAYHYDNGDYMVYVKCEEVSGNYRYTWQIRTVSDDEALWEYSQMNTTQEPPYSTYDVTLYPISGTIAQGPVKLTFHTQRVYARRVSDVVSGTSALPSEDIVDNNRNYTRVKPFDVSSRVAISTILSDNPTKWGIFQPNYYYEQPYSAIYGHSYVPIGQSTWSAASIWLAIDGWNWEDEEEWRTPVKLKNSYPISSVISVLLKEIAPDIKHEGTPEYSAFLYGGESLSILPDLRVFITPKTNITKIGYDEPAKKAPITLKKVFEMLRDCYRLYWFIDGDKKLHIEHIEYFRRGGTYTGAPIIGVDLTQQLVSRNGKSWAFNTKKYEFDKPEMVAWYQFGWMDEVTELFKGNPLEILSKYVNRDNIQNIDINNFTSDIDFMLLTPSNVSQDGFALMAAIISQESKTEVAYAGSTFTLDFIRDLEIGETIRIKATTTATIQDNALVIKDSFGGEIGVLILDGTTQEFILQNGTSYIRLESAGVNITFGGSISANIKFGYELPYQSFTLNNVEYVLQNAYAAFVWLQLLYRYDMPAKKYKRNGIEEDALGIKQLKIQNVNFPALYEPDLIKLVKTSLGKGVIQKITINLSSRNAKATLKYDTE